MSNSPRPRYTASGLTRAVLLDSKNWDVQQLQEGEWESIDIVVKRKESYCSYYSLLNPIQESTLIDALESIENQYK